VFQSVKQRRSGGAKSTEQEKVKGEIPLSLKGKIMERYPQHQQLDEKSFI